MVARPAASLATPGPDTMPWSRVETLLQGMGWNLFDKPDGQIILATPDGQALGQLLAARPDPREPVDGHGLLRNAGGGILDAALAASVNARQSVDEVLVGLNWTLVRAGRYCGIARSPDRGTEGARSLCTHSPLSGHPLSALAQWLCSLDPLRRSVGLAAINAFWNSRVQPRTKGPTGWHRFTPPGEGLVIVGRFHEAMVRLPAARIIEREPVANDIPENQSDTVLAGAKAIAITAQTLMNGSLEPLLARTGHIPQRLLLGPSAPVTDILFDAGITSVSGLAVTSPDQIRTFIAETGASVFAEHLTQPLELNR